MIRKGLSLQQKHMIVSIAGLACEHQSLSKL
jgi:hypothetical protein